MTIESVVTSYGLDHDIECPHCKSSTEFPTGTNSHQCIKCGAKIEISAEMRVELCSAGVANLVSELQDLIGTETMSDLIGMSASEIHDMFKALANYAKIQKYITDHR